MAYFLPAEAEVFPHPFSSDENGFLAVGSNLNIPTLINAYSHGIFPWYNEGDPILWWFTHPRCVLIPDRIKISKSMRSYINQDKYRCTFNLEFETVMRKCRAAKREGQETSWITDEMVEAYSDLHKAGLAHSVEVWLEDQLVGGLYGVSIGKIFSGESMFSEASNASKFALIYLAKHLQEQDCFLIDCQQSTDHLLTMGAEEIDQDTFWKYVKSNKELSLKGKSLNFAPAEKMPDDKF